MGQGVNKVSCDYLVVGSGIAGMSLALLLANSGYKVCLLEKAADVGGSMRRFYRNGVPFDTGFHFTTGLQSEFGDMFRFLNMDDCLQEVEVDKRIYLAESGRMFNLPQGQTSIAGYYSGEFPGTEEAVQKFFDLEKAIYRDTPLFALDSSGVQPLVGLHFSEYDQMPLAEYLKKLALPKELELLLFSFAICCCGTPATELSISTLCRISFGLHEKLVRFKAGGDVVVNRFAELAAEAGVQIITSDHIVNMIKDDPKSKMCHRVLTAKGVEIVFENCVFTTHPHDIMKTVEPICSNAAFYERVSSFEESCGFFTFWAEIMPDADGKGYCDSDASLVSYIPKTNLRTLMSPEDPTNTAAGIMTVKETTADGRECETLTVFENVFPEESREWADTKRGSRGEAYAAYKAERTRQLLQKACEVLPGLENRLNIVATASQLTYRDYLSPYGSAFGIRQKAGQHNLFGRLPVRNCYAIGQNALLPGVFGAMQSAFIIWRKLIGEEKYSEQFNAFHRKRRGYKA